MHLNMFMCAAGDGVYATVNMGNLELVDLKTNTSRTLLDTNDILDVSFDALDIHFCLTPSLQENGKRLGVAQWQLSADMKYMLIKTDYMKVSSPLCALPDVSNISQQWRHSSFGNYYVHELATKETRPLIPPSSPPVTAYATWSPTGESIAFVAENDLYVVPSPLYAPSSSIRSALY